LTFVVIAGWTRFLACPMLSPRLTRQLKNI
jgi:hypothetical protein